MFKEINTNKIDIPSKNSYFKNIEIEGKKINEIFYNKIFVNVWMDINILWYFSIMDSNNF